MVPGGASSSLRGGVVWWLGDWVDIWGVAGEGVPSGAWCPHRIKERSRRRWHRGSFPRWGEGRRQGGHPLIEEPSSGRGLFSPQTQFPSPGAGDAWMRRIASSTRNFCPGVNRSSRVDVPCAQDAREAA